MARKRDLPSPTQKALRTIRKGVKRGLTQKEIQTSIRASLGKGIRDDFLRQGIRFVRGDKDINPPANPRFINREKSPDVNRIRKSVGQITRKYSYQVGVTTTDEDGNKIIIGGVTVSTSKRLSKKAALAEAFSSISESGLEAYTQEEILPDAFDLELTGVLTSDTFLLG